MIVEEAVAATNDLEALERLYSFRQRIQVKRFLSGHAFLVPLLDAAYDITTRYFAPMSLALEVIADPDSTDDQQLVLFVVLQGTPAEAFAKLQRFDNEWWLDAMDEAQGHLCISLEFSASSYLLRSRRSVITSDHDKTRRVLQIQTRSKRRCSPGGSQSTACAP